MIDPDRMLRVKMYNSQNEENYLEINIDSIIGWMGFPDSTMIITNNPNEHCVFTVQDSPDSIKEQIKEVREK
jgi:hypothetical protein